MITVERVKLETAMNSAEKLARKQLGRHVRVSKSLAIAVVGKALELYDKLKSFEDGEVIRFALNECHVHGDERKLYAKIIASYFGQLSGFARKRKAKSRGRKKTLANTTNVVVDPASGQLAWRI